MAVRADLNLTHSANLKVTRDGYRVKPDLGFPAGQPRRGISRTPCAIAHDNTAAPIHSHATVEKS